MVLKTKFNIGDYVWGSKQHQWPPNYYGEVVSWYTPVPLQIHGVHVYTDGFKSNSLHYREQYECLELVNGFPEGQPDEISLEWLCSTPQEWWEKNKGRITTYGMISGEYDEEFFNKLKAYDDGPEE